MSQYDFGTIDPFVVDGTTLATMLNQWRDAIHSVHRGSTRPDYAVPGMLWINDVGGPTNWIANVFLGPTMGDRPLYRYNTTTGQIVLLADGQTLGALDLTGPLNISSPGNAANARQWRSVVMPDGSLQWQALNDDGSTVGWIQFNRDGKITSSAMLASGVFVGVDPPPDPQPTQLWWNSQLGRLFVYYDDGDSVQWVQTTPSGGGGGLVIGGAGSVLQTFDMMSAAWSYYGTQAPMGTNDNPRDINMGLQVGTITLTPLRANSMLQIDAHYNLFSNGADGFGLVAFRDSAPVGSSWISIYGATTFQMTLGTLRLPSNAAAPTTFAFRIGANGGTGYGVNGHGSSRLYGGASRSGFIIREIG